MNQLKHPLQDYAQIGVEMTDFGGVWRVIAWPDRLLHPNPNGRSLAAVPELVANFATQSEAYTLRKDLVGRIRAARRLTGRDVTWLVP